MKLVKCPHCGNTDKRTLQDNGFPKTHPDCTLLCVNRVKPGESSFSYPEDEAIGPDGRTECGMQWEPNEE